MSTQSAHAQNIPISPKEEEFFPGHPKRLTTPEYRATHKHLIKVLDTPCEICGLKNSTLSDPGKNLFKASAIESHHYPVQREYASACDWKKVQLDFPKYVFDQESFLKFVDSPFNMKILCSVHHRTGQMAIHKAIVSDFAIQKYLLDGYILVDDAKNTDSDILKDNQIEDASVPVNERI